MSIFGAMTTAISGLTAQSAAFGNIGDDLANTQTIGYKGVNTTFEDYVSTSDQELNGSSAVVARPEYQNDLQGSITQTSNPLDLAVSGAGFFPVSLQNGTADGKPTFSAQTQYTREGDFKLDANGYIVNSSGHFLNGWVVDANGQVDQTKVVPLQVGQSGYAPVPTSSATLAANLPATPSNNNPFTTEVPVIDAEGNPQNLELTWTPPAAGAPNKWGLSVSQQGAASPLGTYTVSFGTAGNANAPQGTISDISTSAGTEVSAYTPGKQATIPLSANFGLGAQPITLSLGTFGGTDGVTQFAGSTYNLVSLTQNGVPPGSFSSVTTTTSGNIVVNYDNGSSRVLAQIPVVTFSSPDSLQTKDGQAYLPTQQSGTPRLNQAGSSGAGNLVTNSVEASNVDIATEFSKLIVAQRAYSANTKMVTTADDMLQQTIDMKR